MDMNVYNVSGSCSFVDTLATRFGERYKDNPIELAKIIFLVPNRRTQIALKDAFIRFNGNEPSLLPRILPVGDVDEDGFFFPMADKSRIMNQLKPSIDEYERLFIFAKLIAARPQEYGLMPMTWGQAFSLAQDLAKMLDTVYNEQLSLEKLKTLVPEQYAVHWQETLKFLQIITSYWPKILQEKGAVDAVERHNKLLELQAELLADKTVNQKIVAAGIRGTFPGLKKLLAAIKNHPEGEIYFYNLDRFLDDTAWKALDENHPQYAYKELFKFLQISREDVQDCSMSPNPQRERLISEIMRPADDTWRWRELSAEQIPYEAISGLHFIDCADSRQEALSIALILRHVLNTPGKTAALVTPDRTLARRTASELERWGIKIDDSAGRPLHLMPVGIFLRLIIRALDEKLSDSALLSLLKNPFINVDEDKNVWRRKIRNWEKYRRTPQRYDREKRIPQDLVQTVENFKQILMPLQKVYTQPAVDFKLLLETHLRVAETLSGVKKLWSGDDGRTAANLFGRILPQTVHVGTIAPEQYLSFFTALMSSAQVRANYNSHPRIKILGPIEARFNAFDTVIIGSVNEGNWPLIPTGDPWLSRPMKKEFEMSLPEKDIGTMAADFSQLLCTPEVYITRSARSEGTPANKSRWQLRLETVLKALNYPLEIFHDYSYLQLGAMMDCAVNHVKIEPPCPKPPVSARPRCLSASAIEILMRDPYEIFADKILNLKPLDSLDKNPGANDYGNVVHKVLERFANEYPQQLPDDVYGVLLKIGADEFSKNQLDMQVKAFWWPSFVNMALWVSEQEQNYRSDVSHVYGEVEGSYEFMAPAGKFTIKTRADRIDYTTEGTINIIDYKTGAIRSNKEIVTGYAPQLPIEGMIAAIGGFRQKENGKTIPPAKVSQLIYWKLGEKSQTYNKDMPLLLEKTFDRLKRLVSLYDFEYNGYLARPNPKHVLAYTKYEHLARVKEWSVGENDD